MSVASACANDIDLAPVTGGAGGAGGAGGTADTGGAGTGGSGVGGSAGGTTGNGGSNGGGGAASNGGSGGTSVVPPTPALPANAPTLTCPTQITGALEATDATQTGRHSRVVPVSACGTLKSYPGNTADPVNPRLFDVYRFSNPSATAACFNFTLTGGAAPVGDGGVDSDAAAPDAGAATGGSVDNMSTSGEALGPARYLTAYGTFYPTDLAREFQGDVGDVLTSPQTMGITVPAGETVDVVIYAVDVAPTGVGPYTLSCATQ